MAWLSVWHTYLIVSLCLHICVCLKNLGIGQWEIQKLHLIFKYCCRQAYFNHLNRVNNYEGNREKLRIMFRGKINFSSIDLNLAVWAGNIKEKTIWFFFFLNQLTNTYTITHIHTQTHTKKWQILHTKHIS